MQSKPSPNQHRAEDAAWFISASTRQEAREADACMAADDWLYEAPPPPADQAPLATRPAGRLPTKNPLPTY